MMRKIVGIVLVVIIASWAVCAMADSDRAERLYQKAGRTVNWDKAKRYMSMAVEIAPENAKYHEAFAEVHLFLSQLGMGDRIVALRELERAKELNPDEVRLHYRLATLYMQDDTGLDSKARHEIEEVKRLDPNNALAHYEAAYLLYKNDMSEAMWQAVAKGNDQSNVLVYYPSVWFESAGDSIMAITVKTTLEFDSLPHFRSVARGMAAYAASLVRQAEVNGAIEAWESVRLMGRKVMESKPPRIIRLLVGIAIQQIAYSELKTHFAESGAEDKAGLVETEITRLREIMDTCREYSDTLMPKLMHRVNIFLAPTFVLSPIPSQLFLMLIAGIHLLILKRRARRKREVFDQGAAVLPLAWGKAIMLYGVLYIVVAGAASTIVLTINAYPGKESTASMLIWPFGLVISIGAAAVLYLTPIRQSYLSSHDQSQLGIRRFLRFMRSRSLPVSLATVRRQILLLGIGTLMLLCVGGMLSAGYKIHLGVYPWRPDYGFNMMADEELFIENILAEFPYSTKSFK